MPQAITYYDSGVLQELDYDEVAEYAPTYWENTGAISEEYGAVDGSNMFVFAERPGINNHGAIIRKDWVEEVGMKVEDLTSLEKYNEMLMKWKEAGLGHGGGALEAQHFQFSYPFLDWPIDPEYHALYIDLEVADLPTPEAEAFLRNLNYQYNNGLIDDEFYLRTDANQIKSEFVAGNSGVYGEYMHSNSDIYEATLKNNPEAEFAFLPPYTGVPEGNKPIARDDWPFGLIMGINEATTDDERIAVWMYLEWLSQPENLFFFQNGVEGENYTLDSDGIPIADEDFDGESALSPNNNKDYWALVIEAPEYGDEETTIKALKQFWSVPGYEYIVDDMLKYREEVLEYRVPEALFTVVLDSVNEHKTDLNELFQELYLEIVLAPEDEFDEKYEAAVERYLEYGYQEILDEKQEAIDAGHYQ